LVERLVEGALDALGAAPVGDLALRLDRGQVGAVLGRRGQLLVVHASTGRRRSASPAQSLAMITPGMSRFQGCSSVAATIPSSRARSRVDGASSISTSIPISTQRAILSSEQYSSSCGR